MILKKLLVRLFFVGLVFISVATGVAEPAMVDKVIAVVNDEPITQREFDKIYSQIAEKIDKEFTGKEKDAELEKAKKDVMDHLVDAKLAISLAKKEKIEVDTAEVEKRIAKIKSYFRSEQEFLQGLSDKGMTLTEFEKDVKEQILAQKLVDKEVASKIAVSPAEIKDLYDKNKEKFIAPKKVKVRGIMVRKGDGEEDTEKQLASLKESTAEGTGEDFVAGILHRGMVKKSLEEIIGEYKAGKDFATLAAQYSEGPYSEQGGDMGYVSQGEMREEIDTVIFNLKKGEVSNIVETSVGFHVFLAEDVQEPRVMDFAEVSDYLKEQLYMKKFDTELASWLKEKKKNAYISYK